MTFSRRLKEMLVGSPTPRSAAPRRRNRGPTLPEGYSVRYKHWRRGFDGELLPPGSSRTPSGRGGSTLAVLHDRAGTAIASGMAHCRPDENFDKRIGRYISLGRALKNLRMGK